MHTRLLPNEVPVKNGAANMQRGIETVGGWIYLTNMRLIFEAHALNIQYGSAVIPLQGIVKTMPCWTKFLNLFPVFPNSFAVSTTDGKEYRFVSFDRSGWMKSIDHQCGQVDNMQVSAPPATQPESQSVQARIEPQTPRRAVMSGYDSPHPPKTVNVLGIISTVLGGLGLPLSFIPCLNIVGLPFVIIGLLLGLIGFFVAKSGQKSGTGLPIIGITVSTVGLVASIGWIALGAYAIHTAEARAEQEEKLVREGNAVTITAMELGQQYEADESQADRKYKNKILEVTGEIAELPDSDDITPTVKLRTDEFGQTIDCDFRSTHRAQLLSLSPGQNVTIRGRCKGRPFFDVDLDTCILK